MVVLNWEPSGMTEAEKQALRNSFAGKAVSEMTAEERKVFDQDFQYSFGKKPAKNLAVVKSTPPVRSKASTLTVLKLMSLVRGK
tara:strand:+ start:235 stop:486 length:252 start_codon:yes stop_codon:yes gene_type:complete